MRHVTTSPATARLALALAAGAGLAGLGPSPLHWRAAVTGRELAPALAAAAALVGWLVIAVLILALALELLCGVPGAVGRGARALRRVVVPRCARALVATVVGGPLLAGPASAAALPPGGPLGRPSSAASASGPVAGPGAVDPAPVLDRVPGLPPAPTPHVGAAPPAAPAVPRPHSAIGQVVVGPGDSLWRIAARSLGRAATPAQVAETWPRWWATNRRLLGDRPDLIHPGQRLRPPIPPLPTADPTTR